MVISQDDPAVSGRGVSDNPGGGTLTVNFSASVFINSLDLMDATLGNVTFKLFSDANGTGTQVGGDVKNLFNGDTHGSPNFYETIDFTGITGFGAAKSLVISMNGVSGAIDNIQVTAVPIPAAAWLFGSALLGMAGIGYRRNSKA